MIATEDGRSLESSLQTKRASRYEPTIEINQRLLAVNTREIRGLLELAIITTD
jgi:hypothetical protein